MQVVYILGSTRSGTSALRNAIAESRFAGYGEGHLVPLLQQVAQAVRNAKESWLGADTEGTGLAAMQEHVLIRHFFFGYEEYLRKTLESTYVLDKTPTIEPIKFAPQLNLFHQDAKFIHCSRRHVDNVLSKQKKFSGKTVEQHAREWAHCNEAWLEARDKMHGNYLEFDFFDLSHSTAATSRSIGQYLELDGEEIDAMTQYLVSKRPQADPSRDVTQFAKLSETPWTELEREAFLEVCAPVGERLGYGFETYFR